MRIKNLLNTLAIVLLSTIIIACDDNLNSIGENIQPDGDGIIVGVDSTVLTARTVSFKDSVYARTIYGLLGQYDDPIFGRVKSDYLCEFLCPDSISFRDKVVSIDSVFLQLACYGFTGDSISPMGLSTYEITQPLRANFFTNIDPNRYTDNMSKLLGQGIFSIKDLPAESGFKLITTKLNQALGKRFYDEWKRPGSTTFKNSDNLKEFFKGMYITTTFGSGSLINVGYTRFQIYYTYTGRNSDDTADSTRVDVFHLTNTPEVIQLSHIKNSIPDNILEYNPNKAYLKTPAGVCTELTIPLNDIVSKAGRDRIVNSASFMIKGFTEEEAFSKLNRPDSILFINKDSLPNFFLNGGRVYANSPGAFLIKRRTISSTNTVYDNIYDCSNNFANVIVYYANLYKNEAVIPDLKYMIIPVRISTSTSTNYTTVYNLMNPTSAVLRTDEENMKMKIIFSEYKKAERPK